MSYAQGKSQDTGNPVLDSTVNIVTSNPNIAANPELIRELHSLMLDLYAKEPKPEPRKRLTAEQLQGKRR